MRPLCIFPFNGNALEAVDCLGEDYTLTGFVDDNVEKQGKIWAGVEVNDRSYFNSDKNVSVLAVPGSPNSYKERDKTIRDLGFEMDRFATVIHPTATVSPFAKIGRNVLIMAGVVITSNAVIKDHVCILPNTVVHHDVLINEYSIIGSNVTIAGGVNVGRKCYIASGVSIINDVSIGNETLIGIGSNVIKNIPEGKIAIGNPARIIK